jgi:hypothetical protein
MPKSLTPKSTPTPKPAPTAPVAILQTEITKITKEFANRDLTVLELEYMGRQLKALTVEADALFKAREAIPKPEKVERVGVGKSDADIKIERDFLYTKAKSNWSQTYPSNSAVKRFDINTFDFKGELTVDKTKIGEVINLDQAYPPGVSNAAEFEEYLETHKPKIFDPNTDQGFKTWLKQERKTTGITGNTKRYEVIEYVTKVLSKNSYIPGLETWKWIQENKGHANLKDLKDDNWYYTASSLFRDGNGNSNVPVVSWNDGGFHPNGLFLDNDLHSNHRFLLFLL